MALTVTPQIFCDLDGTLSDYFGFYKTCFGINLNYDNEDELTDYSRIQAHGSFYRDQPLKSDSLELWNGIRNYCITPIILTGVPNGIPNVREHKLEWVKNHIGPDIKVICCRSKDKYLYGKPYDILIDDRIKYRQYWKDMGGLFIHHIDTKMTLNIIRRIYAPI